MWRKPTRPNRIINNPNKKAPSEPLACPYPKLKHPSGHVAGRVFLRGCLADLPLFKRGQPAEKSLCITSGKTEKDLGKDKQNHWRGFPFLVAA